MAQDVQLQPLQRHGRFEAQLVGEVLPVGGVVAQRVGVPPTGVQRPHQRAARPLAQRMRRDERFDLPDRRGGAASRGQRLEALLGRDEPQLVEPHRLQPDGLQLGELDIRRSAPQRERVTEPLGTVVRIPPGLASSSSNLAASRAPGSPRSA